MTKLAGHYVEIGAKTDKFDRGMDRVENSFKRLGTKLTSVGKKLTLGITLPIAAIGGAAIKTAMDAVESENLFEVSMKGMADAARRWSEELGDKLGLNRYEIRKTVATFNVMLNSMGLGEQASYDMAKGLTQLAYDMASFYNLRPAEAFQKLQAGISGEIEPLKRLGILVNENTIKHWALTEGIIKQGEQLTEQQKVMARFNVIMEQTTDAQGDLARTLDSPTNKLRVLKSRVQELGITIGMRLLPLFERILSYAEKVVKWFSNLDDTTKSLTITVAGFAAAIGPVAMITGKLVQTLPTLAKTMTGLRASFISTAGGAAILLGALAATIYYVNQLKVAQKAGAEASIRTENLQTKLSAKLKKAADIAGLSTEEFLKLRDSYNLNSGAMAMAIYKGKEGEKLQKALIQVGKEQKEQIDKQRVSIENFIPKIDEVADKQKTWIDYLHEQGFMTLEEQSERVQELQEFLEGLHTAYSDGKITLEAYLASIKAIKDEQAELSTTITTTAIPATDGMANVILANAVPAMEKIGFKIDAVRIKIGNLAKALVEDFNWAAEVGIFSLLDAFQAWGEGSMGILEAMGGAIYNFVNVAIEGIKRLMVQIYREALQTVFAKQVEAIASAIASVMKSIPFPLNLALVGGAIAATSALFSGLKPKRFEHEGLAVGPTFAMLGEKKPERVIHEEKYQTLRTQAAMAGGPAVRINFAPQISAIDSHDVERFFRTKGREQIEKIFRDNVGGIASEIKAVMEKV